MHWFLNRSTLDVFLQNKVYKVTVLHSLQLSSTWWSWSLYETWKKFNFKTKKKKGRLAKRFSDCWLRQGEGPVFSSSESTLIWCRLITFTSLCMQHIPITIAYINDPMSSLCQINVSKRRHNSQWHKNIQKRHNSREAEQSKWRGTPTQS